jgi:hypothetical protein
MRQFTTRAGLYLLHRWAVMVFWNKPAIPQDGRLVGGGNLPVAPTHPVRGFDGHRLSINTSSD